jgi:hypothetical protein
VDVKENAQPLPDDFSITSSRWRAAWREFSRP